LADLLDVNIWVALSLTDHPFHARAVAYWHNQADERLLFCRTTLLGTLRVCSLIGNGGSPLTVGDSWSVISNWRSAPGVSIASEPIDLDRRIEVWVRGGFVRPRTWTDAYLAAFALVGGYRFVTFDRDYQRFPGLDLLHLT